MLHINNISKSYVDADETHQILRGLTLQITQGESLSIQGASGSGKSTLLHLLAALDKPDGGKILLHNTNAVDDAKDKVIDITALSEGKADSYRQQHIGLIFQKFNF